MKLHKYIAQKMFRLFDYGIYPMEYLESPFSQNIWTVAACLLKSDIADGNRLSEAVVTVTCLWQNGIRRCSSMLGGARAESLGCSAGFQGLAGSAADSRVATILRADSKCHSQFK
jgi:hypothetical protein